MSQEVYERWDPVQGVPSRMYCDAIHDDHEGFRILLRPEDPTCSTLRIRFEGAIGYRNVNESYRQRTWSRFDGEGLGSLFCVANSDWVDWIKKESAGVLDNSNVVHYAILTDEDCIEVVSEFPPDVEWLGE